MAFFVAIFHRNWSASLILSFSLSLSLSLSLLSLPLHEDFMMKFMKLRFPELKFHKSKSEIQIGNLSEVQIVRTVSLPRPYLGRVCSLFLRRSSLSLSFSLGRSLRAGREEVCHTTGSWIILSFLSLSFSFSFVSFFRSRRLVLSTACHRTKVNWW